MSEDYKARQLNPNMLDGNWPTQESVEKSLRGGDEGQKISPEELRLRELRALGLDPFNVKFAATTGQISPARTVREEVLETAKDAVTQDRNADYGTPEDNFANIAAYWTTYLRSVGFEMATTNKDRRHNYGLNSTDVAAMLSLMKHSRLATSPGKMDNWVDIAGYAACGAECASKGSGVPE